MADKETKAERREAARKARIEAQRRAARRKSIRRIYGLAAVVLIAALIGGLVWFSGKSKREADARLNTTFAQAAGCTAVQTAPLEGSDHLDDTEIAAQKQVEYKTEPPTSGEHHPQWANTGVHSSPVPDENFVHNLEHGHVVVIYDPDRLDEGIIDALEAFARDRDTQVLITPRPELAAQPFPLAFAAWTTYATCASPTTPEAAVDFAEAFTSVHQGNGPEKVPGTPN